MLERRLVRIESPNGHFAAAKGTAKSCVFQSLHSNPGRASNPHKPSESSGTTLVGRTVESQARLITVSAPDRAPVWINPEPLDQQFQVTHGKENPNRAQVARSPSSVRTPERVATFRIPPFHFTSVTQRGISIPIERDHNDHREPEDPYRGRGQSRSQGGKRSVQDPGASVDLMLAAGGRRLRAYRWNGLAL